MSNLPASRAESAGILIAPELAGYGVQPTAGWLPMEPDQDQINDFYRNIKTIAPSPISVERQEKAPVIVDADAMPKLQMDLTRDLLNQVAEGMFLAKPKHGGGTAQSFFTPSARTTTAYTVAALGNLPAGTLVYGSGWLNAANNGLQVVGASSTGTSINVASGVAETPSGYQAILEVAGRRGASGDLAIDVNGNMTCTADDFTTWGLTPGQWIWIGGVQGSAFAFATAGYTGFAKVVSVAAKLVTLARRQWTIGAADPGTGKTIDVYFTRWHRNVATTHADWLERSYGLELSLSSIGAGGAAEYMYGKGMQITSFEIAAPNMSLIKTTLNFIGTDVTDPSLTRATGADTAPVPLLVDRFTPVNEPYISIVNAATEARIADDITGFSLSYDNGITGQKQHGTLGTKRTVIGKVHQETSFDLVLTQDDAIKACSNNTTLAFGAGLRNNNGGIFIDVPSLKFSGAVPKFPANGQVTISPKAGGFIDAVGRYTMGISVFAYLPPAVAA